MISSFTGTVHTVANKVLKIIKRIPLVQEGFHQVPKDGTFGLDTSKADVVVNEANNPWRTILAQNTFARRSGVNCSHIFIVFYLHRRLVF